MTLSVASPRRVPLRSLAALCVGVGAPRHRAGLSFGNNSVWRSWNRWNASLSLNSLRALHSSPHSRSSHKKTPLSDDGVAALATRPQRQLSLADLVKHGRPPLSTEALLSSANFTLSLLPIRLAHRIQAIRNLPFIVVSNPNISRIYQNYQHSLSTLLPWLTTPASSSPDHIYNDDGDDGLPTLATAPVRTLADETRFTETLANLVATHQNTIPVLARGFIECRRYINPEEVTRFLNEHLHARIGTRLVAEQHIHLHNSSRHEHDAVADSSSASAYVGQAKQGQSKQGQSKQGQSKQGQSKQGQSKQEGQQGQEGQAHQQKQPSTRSPADTTPDTSFIGVIDTALNPSHMVEYCASIVADTAETKYGVRPRIEIDGELDTTFCFVPMHLEYIVTELLKNAFRATAEKDATEPVRVTIAPEPPTPASQRVDGLHEAARATRDGFLPLDDNAPGVTIRIRDRGGGIAPNVLPHIWSYSFTTVPEDDDNIFFPGSGSGLSAIANAAAGGSSMAGLGYGLPLSRTYAEYFGGGIQVQSLHGWGTDVYLRLKGVGKVE